MKAADQVLAAAGAAPGRSGKAALVRLCLGFVGGWWLLQGLLLVTGLIAIDRVQSQLTDARLASLGATLQTALGQGGRDLPVTRFQAQAEAMRRADPAVAAILLLDGKGGVQSDGDANAPRVVPEQALRLPVSGGSIAVALDRAKLEIEARWRQGGLILIALALPLLHFPLARWLRHRIAKERTLPWLAVNGLTGVATSLLLVGGLLYESQLDTVLRHRAVEMSLGAVATEMPANDRLAPLVAKYQAIDPGIERIAISLPGDPPTAISFWQQERRLALDAGKELTVLRRWPPIDVSSALMGGLKNLAVLILAIALASTVLAGTLPGFKLPLAALSRPGPVRADGGGETSVLEAVRPIYFLAVLAENLCAPFLPGVLHDVVQRTHLAPQMASALFMAYFIAFTGVLLPAGWLIGRFGEGWLIRVGAAMLALGLFLPALSLDPSALLVARLLAGGGQGVLLIGVQSLILTTTSSRQRTGGTSIIVFGYNGGMIGGNAFGSLLVERIGSQAVFAVAGAVVVAIVLIAFPAFANAPASREEARPARPGRRLDFSGLYCLRDPAFLLTTLCIGIPTKMVLTGVVLFALPLMLGHWGFSLEEVGQVAMFYAVGVVAATTTVSNLLDRQRHPSHFLNTGTLLTVGALFSALGMAAILVAENPIFGVGTERTALLIGCILLLGVAHGCINAPVVTHIADLPVAQRLGPVRVATTYRLLERFGHMAGPMVVERVLAACARESLALAWIAVAVVVFAAAFLVQNLRGRK